MAPTQSRLIAVAVFGVGVFVGLVVPSLTAHTFGIGRPLSAPEWQLTLEVSAFAAVATSAGFAVARCKSVFRALCAVPIAVLVTALVPGHWGLWLSASFHSVIVNAVAAGLLFAVVGASAGWLVSKFFNREPRHA